MQNERTMLIENARIVTPTGVIGRGWVLCRDGKIAAIGEGAANPSLSEIRLNAKGELLLPGFVDVHVHGSDGVDTMDATPEVLDKMSRFYARHGVTSFLATTWTDTHERITAALETVRDTMKAMQAQEPRGAHLLGVHLEGPYLNPAKCGAQNVDLIRQADPAEAIPWLDLDVIRLLALAPEFPDNHWLIDACIGHGITVSIAHTSATYEETLSAIQQGVMHSTHTFNAMPPLLHREPGVLGAVLNDPRVRCELISDLIHVHPALIRLLWQIKKTDGLLLITDAMRAAGLPDGDYPVDTRTIQVRDGVARLPDGTLAGSTLTMDRAVYRFMQTIGEPLEVLWPVTSRNAANAIHVGHCKGSIEIGKDADLVLVNAQTVTVHATLVAGTPVYLTPLE
jgi:N-acetylglucosamine-6-phosphate deacetylase